MPFLRGSIPAVKLKAKQNCFDMHSKPVENYLKNDILYSSQLLMVVEYKEIDIHGEF